MEVFEELERLYAWIDAIPLSKCSKNLTRDFSDGFLMAELCKYFFPKVVDLHNYPPANSHAAKVTNWETLNLKVFSKLQIKVTLDLIHQIATGVPGALESVLLAIKNKVEDQQRQKGVTAAGQVKAAWGESGDSSALDADANHQRIIISDIKKLKKEVQLINKNIAKLNQKVGHLEQLLETKERLLIELKTDVDRLKLREYDSEESFSLIPA